MSLAEQSGEQNMASAPVVKAHINDTAARDVALARFAAVLKALEEVLDY